MKLLTVLYFNLIYDARMTFGTKFGVSTESCMAVCLRTFATHYSRVEKLSVAHSNALDALYYHSSTCDLVCLYGPDISFTQVAIMMIVPVTLFIIITIRLGGVIENECIITIVSVLSFITTMIICQLVLQLLLQLLYYVVPPINNNIFRNYGLFIHYTLSILLVVALLSDSFLLMVINNIIL